MGAGKTTVAESLAGLFGLSALDLDAVIEQRRGLPIYQIIKNFGESEFRRAETEVLLEILQTNNNFVLALGGGAWTRTENRDLINDYNCRAIWLDAEFELCWNRIETAIILRPLAPTEQRARELFAERLPLYQTAETRISVRAGQTPEEIAREIGDKLDL